MTELAKFPMCRLAAASGLLMLATFPIVAQAAATLTIHGVLRHGERPIPEATVLLGTSSSYDSPCAGAVPVAVTDTKGGFVATAKIPAESIMDSLLQPGLVQQLTTVCFQVKDAPPMLGAQLVTPGATSSEKSIVCDTALPKTKSMISIAQICRE